jgi:transcription elongation factor GreB
MILYRISGAMSEINYITPQGFEKLMNEQDLLLTKERPELCKVIAWAASLGDRSENADYIYSKKRLREIDKRLRFLKKRIEIAQVVDPKKVKSEKIQFGATIVISDEDGATKKISIVGVDEIETSKGKISWKSPLGMSLLGKTLGDEVSVNAPGGERIYTVEEIHYTEIKS